MEWRRRVELRRYFPTEMVIFRGDEEGLFACLLKFLKVEGERGGRERGEKAAREEGEWGGILERNVKNHWEESTWRAKKSGAFEVGQHSSNSDVAGPAAAQIWSQSRTRSDKTRPIQLGLLPNLAWLAASASRVSFFSTFVSCWYKS